MRAPDIPDIYGRKKKNTEFVNKPLEKNHVLVQFLGRVVFYFRRIKIHSK